MLQLKFWSAWEASHHPAYMGNCPYKGVKTWVQSKILSYCFVFGVNQEN